MRGWPIWPAVALHVVVAVLYTTPWDNYLVATRVWWYDPALVTGLTIGWVPIEEYTFFILQPILAGLWLVFLLRRAAASESETRPTLRLWLPVMLGILWLGAAGLLLSGWRPGTYLALELVWALPPIALQFAFGADILWQQRRLLLLAIGPVTLFLSAADALAIGWGTWTINPEKSLNVFLGGTLPVEEFVFFLLTNTLVTFGLVLIWAEVSHRRLLTIRRFLASKRLFKPFAGPGLLKESDGHFRRRS
jgi:lycopene cyclase domain-containing protein